MKTSILLVDDHAIVRQGMASLLDMTEEFAVVGQASDGTAAIAMAQQLQPDIVLLDLLMPGISGAEAIRQIREVSSRSQIAVLTSVEDDDLAFAAIEAGAHSYLIKAMSGEQILDALRRMTLGEPVVHASIAQRLLQRMRSIPKVKVDPFASLTERELQVLKALAEGASNIRIAKMLHIGESTVKTHIGNVLAKLYLADRTEAVAFAWREGLLAPKPPR